MSQIFFLRKSAESADSVSAQEAAVLVLVY